MSRIAYAMGLLVGVLFAFAAYVAVTNSLSVGVSTTASNPVCQVPLVGFGCSIGLISPTINQTAVLTIQGLGLIVIESMVLFFIVMAMAGFLLLLVLRRNDGGRAWSWAVAGLVLGFLAVISLLLGGLPLLPCNSPIGLCVFSAWYYTVAGVVFGIGAIALWMRSGSGTFA